MGAEPYWYTVPYHPDINLALQQLRDREFRAGRYNPVIAFPSFPITGSSPCPGPQHGSIEEAMAATDADGTRSILDIFNVGDEPDMLTASPLKDETIESIYGTKQPTREMVEANRAFLGEAGRGQAIYMVIYAGESPSEILFAGYSFD